MPFTPPWRDFAEGDLVYGVETVQGGRGRRKYINEAFKPKGAATIDEFEPIQGQGKKPAPLSQQSFNETLKGHEKYRYALTPMMELIDDDAKWNSAVRRKDKAGLYWATLVASKHVHFVLDGIDLKAVVTKSFDGQNPDEPIGKAGPGVKKNRSITGSELRWIFRHRAHPNVQSYIQFWLDDGQVAPPWQQDEDLWGQYKPTITYVHEDAPEDSGCGCLIM